MVVAMISIDPYPFLASSDLTCYLEDTGIGLFWFQCRVRIWKQKKLCKKMQPQQRKESKTKTKIV